MLVGRQKYVNEVSKNRFSFICRVIIMAFSSLAIVGTAFMNDLKNKRNRMKSSFLPTLKDDKKLKARLKSTVAEKFWECFSVTNNGSFIMSTKLSKNSIQPIHGIRALGALWIFAGHVYYYAFGPTDNIQLIFAYASSWLLQPLFAAAISVDSFYVMRWTINRSIKSWEKITLWIISSGFLLSYAFYEKQKKRPSKQLTIDVIKGILYRYIRIAPCFMIVSKTAVCARAE